MPRELRGLANASRGAAARGDARCDQSRKILRVLRHSGRSLPKIKALVVQRHADRFRVAHLLGEVRMFLHRSYSQILASLCLVAPLFAQGVMQVEVEQRLFEMLREQNAITQPQYNELLELSRSAAERADFSAQVGSATAALVAQMQDQPPSVAYKAGKGFAFTTADHRASMIVGGRVQARLSSHWPENGQENIDINASRVRLWLKGHAFSTDWKYEIQLELAGRRVKGDVEPSGTFASDARFAYAKEAWICWEPSKAMNAYWGIFPAPYSRQLYISDSKQQFVNRWIGNDEFAPDDQTGMWVGGEFGGADSDLFRYDVSVVNGTGLNVPAGNSTLMYTGRITFNPFGGVDDSECDLSGRESFGLQLGLNAWTKENDLLNAADSCLGGDATLVWKGLYATAEYHDKTHAEGGPNTKGWFVQAGWFMVPGELEIGVRHARIEFGGLTPSEARITETLGVIGWFVDGHRFKTQLDCGVISSENLLGAEEDE